MHNLASPKNSIQSVLELENINCLSQTALNLNLHVGTSKCNMQKNKDIWQKFLIWRKPLNKTKAIVGYGMPSYFFPESYT
jgi:hypothetical protein